MSVTKDCALYESSKVDVDFSSIPAVESLSDKFGVLDLCVKNLEESIETSRKDARKLNRKLKNDLSHKINEVGSEMRQKTDVLLNRSQKVYERLDSLESWTKSYSSYIDCARSVIHFGDLMIRSPKKFSRFSKWLWSRLLGIKIYDVITDESCEVDED